jgi:arginyl-tRNA synthetase
MKTIKNIIQNDIISLISNLWNLQLEFCSVRDSQNIDEFDYQVDICFSLSKNLKKNPKELADIIMLNLQNNANYSSISVTGPGFINLKISNELLKSHFNNLYHHDNLGVEKSTNPSVIIVDYSSPNIAKEMHVGHLRSSIIGDSLVRMLDFLGHNVIKQNHIGDWGTQFGFLLQYIIDNKLTPKSISDLTKIYKDARLLFDNDSEFEKRSRNRLVSLQSGEQESLDLWQETVNISYVHFREIFHKLGLLLEDSDIRGESFYNNMLPDIVTMLEEQNIATISQGAVVIFMQEFLDKEKNIVPMIIKKSDGGYLYHTTDLAAAKFRIDKLNADHIIYVTDSRQKQHFEMLFSVLNNAGWTKDTRLSHVGFGSVLGEDKKPFKSRSGEVISLASLLNEAEEKALTNLVARYEYKTASDLEETARIIGIGALKYADLSTELVKDYVFSWDKMLSFQGNTSPYLQNAYVRVKSIFRKGEFNCADLKYHDNFQMSDAIEVKLILKLAEFPDIIDNVYNNLAPNLLCNYLYNLANIFHNFYEKCHILNENNHDIKLSRLIICNYFVKVMQQGLYLLGIDIIEEM